MEKVVVEESAHQIGLSHHQKGVKSQKVWNQPQDFRSSLKMKVSRRHGTEVAKVVSSGLYRSLHKFQLNCNTPQVWVLFLAQQETCGILYRVSSTTKKKQRTFKVCVCAELLYLGSIRMVGKTFDLEQWPLLSRKRGNRGRFASKTV